MPSSPKAGLARSFALGSCALLPESRASWRRAAIRTTERVALHLPVPKWSGMIAYVACRGTARGSRSDALDTGPAGSVHSSRDGRGSGALPCQQINGVSDLSKRVPTAAISLEGVEGPVPSIRPRLI